tara:strand:+ start:1211 stop:1588 length:378 start_codon:yes stop_codon:yes gene_type:complete
MDRLLHIKEKGEVKMAIGDPQKVVNPGGHTYGGKKAVKAAKTRVSAEAKAMKKSKQVRPPASRTGEVKMPSAKLRTPKRQPAAGFAKKDKGTPIGKSEKAQKAPRKTQKKKPSVGRGGIKGKSYR